MLTHRFEHPNHVRKSSGKLRFWTPKSRNFGLQESDFSDTLETMFGAQNRKNLQNLEKSAKSRKVRKSALFGCLKGILRVQPESLSGAHFGRFRQVWPDPAKWLSDLSDGCPKVRKKCENFGKNFGPRDAKKPKKCSNFRRYR